MGRPFLVNIIIRDYGSIPGTVSEAQELPTEWQVLLCVCHSSILTKNGRTCSKKGCFFFSLPGVRCSCDKSGTEAPFQRRKGDKKQGKIQVTKKIEQNRLFIRALILVPQGGGKYVLKQPCAWGKNEVTQWVRSCRVCYGN